MYLFRIEITVPNVSVIFNINELRLKDCEEDLKKKLCKEKEAHSFRYIIVD